MANAYLLARPPRERLEHNKSTTLVSIDQVDKAKEAPAALLACARRLVTFWPPRRSLCIIISPQSLRHSELTSDDIAKADRANVILLERSSAALCERVQRLLIGNRMQLDPFPIGGWPEE